MNKPTRASLLTSLLLAAALAAIAAGCGGSGSDGRAAGGDPVEVLEPAAALVDAIPSLAEPDERQPDTYVGKASDGRYFVAIVIRGDDAVVYVCDGNALGDWLGARVSGVHISGSSDDGTSIDAELAGREMSGTIAPAGGEELDFTAAAAEPGSGLFREAGLVRSENAVLGWIVANDGAIRGVIQGGKLGVGAPVATDPLDGGGVVDDGSGAPSEPAPVGEGESGSSGGCKDAFPRGCSLTCAQIGKLLSDYLQATEGATEPPFFKIAQEYRAQLSRNGCTGRK